LELLLDVSIIERLVSFLKPFLVDYLDPVNDQIGVRLSQLNSVVYGNPTMDGFARTLVKMSAQIGSQHVANHFFSWTKGEPIRFQINALLKGVRLDKPFEAHGITLFNLPKDSRKVWQQLPFSRILPMQVTSMDLMGGIVISIESKVCPALYRPDNNFKQMDISMGTDNFSIKSLEKLCDSISLTCNGSVSWVMLWRDLGNLWVFFDLPQSGYGFWHRNYTLQVEITQEKLDKGLEIYQQMSMKESSGGYDNLEQAIHRWTKSKQASTIPDKLIELRIALESLYGIKESEKGYRLSTYCAWHLGNDFNGRCTIFDTMQNIYRLSSKAVHGGKPNCDSNLVKEGQDICRDGILKRLGESKEPDWKKLILGKETKSST